MDTKKISKYLSYLLRHQPEALNLNMDAYGWVDVDELLEKWNTSRAPITYEILQRVVAENNKQRFKLEENKRRIRANQGHSINIQLELEKTEPPVVLYHGTARRNLESILQQGLTKMNRQHVHLSADDVTAKQVGSRHGKPVILFIDTARMHEEGFPFYLSENQVWLTDRVPAKYISIT